MASALSQHTVLRRGPQTLTETQRSVIRGGLQSQLISCAIHGVSRTIDSFIAPVAPLEQRSCKAAAPLARCRRENDTNEGFVAEHRERHGPATAEITAQRNGAVADGANITVGSPRREEGGSGLPTVPNSSTSWIRGGAVDGAPC
ncbi:hypothetical protein AAFF_G00134020 [Aldrovandia affinis]|uniref:Uncharacterized protein n=1 Tax=Aldrovandia affinis TaxID=143900 RepID=A0AAD7W8Y0_9TELE|nr:hypothetical protein AAFF_G00134020 [Aldrovandia affinis]